MFKFKLQHLITSALALALIGVLAGCTAPATPADPTSPPVQPTDTPLPTPTNSVSQWEQVSKIESPDPVRMAAFLNQDFGVTGSPAIPAHITSDGGKTWTEASNSSGCIFGLEVIDAKTIWECNNSDVRVTTDGGQTWTDSVRGFGTPGCKISAIDAKTAWVITQGLFIVTHDGGVTREKLALPSKVRSTKYVAVISFRNETDGYMLDVKGNLYVTADGGKTWADMPPLDFSKYGKMELMPDNGQPYAALRFLDAKYGLIILSLAGGGNKVVALQTADGGQTWTEQVVQAPFGTPYLTRDGKYMTMISTVASQEITIFRYTGE